MTVEILVFTDVIEVGRVGDSEMTSSPTTCLGSGRLLQCKFRLNRQFLST